MISQSKEVSIKDNIKDGSSLSRLSANFLSASACNTLTIMFPEIVDLVAADLDKRIDQYTADIQSKKAMLEELAKSSRITSDEFRGVYPNIAKRLDITDITNEIYQQVNLKPYMYSIIQQLETDNIIDEITAQQMRLDYENDRENSVRNLIYENDTTYKTTTGKTISLAKMVDLAYTRYLINDLQRSYTSELKNMIVDCGLREKYNDLTSKIATCEFLNSDGQIFVYYSNLVQTSIQNSWQFNLARQATINAGARKHAAIENRRNPELYIARLLGYVAYSDDDIKTREKKDFVAEYGKPDILESVTEDRILGVLKQNGISIESEVPQR